jgi:hypothetical protein
MPIRQLPTCPYIIAYTRLKRTQSGPSGDNTVPNLTREQGIQIGKIEMTFTFSITTALYWQFRDHEGTHRTKNGSLFFVDIGSGPFAVTASHVLAEYRRDVGTFDEIGNLRIAADNRSSLPIDLSARLLAEHSGIDIATLCISQMEIDLLQRSTITVAPTSWPPTPPVQDGDIVYCGFPGNSRRPISETQLHIFATVSTGPASSVSDKDISLLIDRTQLIPVMGQGIPPENFNFGGISGGPFLSVINSPIRQLTVAGVIYQGPNPSDSSDEAISGLEIIRARRAHFILPDGQLDTALWHSFNL